MRKRHKKRLQELEQEQKGQAAPPAAKPLRAMELPPTAASTGLPSARLDTPATLPPPPRLPRPGESTLRDWNRESADQSELVAQPPETREVGREGKTWIATAVGAGRARGGVPLLEVLFVAEPSDRTVRALVPGEALEEVRAEDLERALEHGLPNP